MTPPGLGLGQGANEVRGTLVAAGVLDKVLLVVVFGVVPDLERLDLGDDVVVGVPRLLRLVAGGKRRLLLLLGLVVDATAVLGALVGTLAVDGGGVVHSEEKVQDLQQRQLRRFVRDLETLLIA